MDEQEFQKLIEQLHVEIQNTKTVDDKGQELLRHLDSDIRELLGKTGAYGVPVRPSTVRRLEEALDHFEVTHPELTTLLGKFLEGLSNVGI